MLTLPCEHSATFSVFVLWKKKREAPIQGGEEAWGCVFLTLLTVFPQFRSDNKTKITARNYGLISEQSCHSIAELTSMQAQRQKRGERKMSWFCLQKLINEA